MPKERGRKPKLGKFSSISPKHKDIFIQENKSPVNLSLILEEVIRNEKDSNITPKKEINKKEYENKHLEKYLKKRSNIYSPDNMISINKKLVI